jgi:hypothetical protein
MVSTRNVDIGNGDYELLKRYAGGGDSELAQSRAVGIREAVEQTIKSVLGGEFMTNVRIYKILSIDKSAFSIDKGEQVFYYAAEGDVWGIRSNALEYYGFAVGDEVIWTEHSVSGNSQRQARGAIKTLINDRECLVERQNGDKLKINYDLLTKIGQ